MKRLLGGILALVMGLACVAAVAEDVQAAVAAIVNGEKILQSEVDAQAQAYLTQYANGGLDAEDEAVAAFAASQALTAVIDDHLLTQDMTRMGVYAFTQEEQADILEKAQTGYASVVTQLASLYAASAQGEAPSADEMLEYGQQLAEQLGYSPDAFAEYYQNDLASQKYAAALMGEETISDEAVQAAYEQRVNDSREKYAEDVAAFEAALSAGQEVWYVPEGYRQVLQIFLRSDAEDKLADTRDTVAEIYERLEAGESFVSLIAAYGEDAALQEESMLEDGYMVNAASVMWADAFVAAAFSPELAAPGDYARTPLAGDDGVHILYYLGDRAGGPVALTDTLREALRQTLYNQRANEKVFQRLQELEDAADIQLPGAAE